MKTSKGPWALQSLGTKFRGYDNWPTFAVRDAQNQCIAEVGHVDRGTVASNKANATLMASAPTMRIALTAVLCNLELAEKTGCDLGAYGRLAKEAAADALRKVGGDE